MLEVVIITIVMDVVAVVVIIRAEVVVGAIGKIVKLRGDVGIDPFKIFVD